VVGLARGGGLGSRDGWWAARETAKASGEGTGGVVKNKHFPYDETTMEPHVVSVSKGGVRRWHDGGPGDVNGALASAGGDIPVTATAGNEGVESTVIGPLLVTFDMVPEEFLIVCRAK